MVLKGSRCRKVFLFILEFLGTTELLVILIVALIIFGPRKLPQLSRSLGKSLAEFKRASEDFKTTWEKEVTLEEMGNEARIGRAMLPEEDSILSETVERSRAISDAAQEGAPEAETSYSLTPSTIAADSTPPQAAPVVTDAPASEPTRKQDWL